MLRDPYCRILFGYIINNFFECDNQQIEKGISLEQFSILFIAPILMKISLFILTNREINSTYKQIYFVARDGFLPLKAYDIMRNGKKVYRVFIYMLQDKHIIV